DSHGTFNAAAGATLNFAGGTMTLESNSTLTAAGTVSFSGATVEVNGSYTVSGSTAISGGTANFNWNATSAGGALSGGNLSGSGALTVSGALSWTGGNMNGSGTTVIPSGGSLMLSGANNKLLGQRTINNRSEERRVGKSVELGGGRVIKKKRKIY